MLLLSEILDVACTKHVVLDENSKSHFSFTQHHIRTKFLLREINHEKIFIQ